MANRLVAKLQGYGRLSEADQLSVIDALGPAREILARTDLISEGDDPRAINVILDGWACRYRQLSDGRRQIVSLLLPGDLCDPQIYLLDKIDHTIGAITPVSFCQITGAAMHAVTINSTSLRLAFHRAALASMSIQREWTVCVGIRTGIERLAHLLCEIRHRLAVVGLATDTTCPQWWVWLRIQPARFRSRSMIWPMRWGKPASTSTATCRSYAAWV